MKIENYFNKFDEEAEDCQNDRDQLSYKEENGLYDGKLIKFQKTFNLLALKNKIWEILEKVNEKINSLDGEFL